MRLCKKEIRYWGRYKCRLCGTVFKSGMVSDRKDAFCEALKICYQLSQEGCEPKAVHSCIGGGVGIADFLGYVEDKEED